MNAKESILAAILVISLFGLSFVAIQSNKNTNNLLDGEQPQINLSLCNYENRTDKSNIIKNTTVCTLEPVDHDIVDHKTYFKLVRDDYFCVAEFGVWNPFPYTVEWEFQYIFVIDGIKVSGGFDKAKTPPLTRGLFQYKIPCADYTFNLTGYPVLMAPKKELCRQVIKYGTKQVKVCQR